MNSHSILMKEVSIALCIFFLLSLLPGHDARLTRQGDNHSTPAAWINPSTQILLQGSQFCADVYIDSNGIDVLTVGIQIAYPSPDFSVINLTEQGLLGTAILPVGGDDGAGVINYAVTRQSSVNPAAPLNGKFVTICFSTVNASMGLHNLDFIQVEIYDENIESIPGIELSNGQVTLLDPIPPLMATCLGPSTGTVELPFGLTGNATGGTPPYTYHWEFGDGNSSADQSPTYTYSTADTFTITLTVMDNSSRISDCTMLITVASAGNLLPQATITFPSGGDILSGTVNITGTAIDSDGTIQKIEIRVDETVWLIAMGTTTWYFKWDTSQVTQGNHTLTVRAYDELDHSHPKTIKVFVDNTGKNGNGTPGFEIVILTIGLIFTILIKRKK